MPKNKGKGGKNRRRGKNENDVLKRELIEKDENNQGINAITNIVLFKHRWVVLSARIPAKRMLKRK